MHGALWLTILLHPLGWAQEGFGQYHYQYKPPVPVDGQYSGYQWRPFEDQNPYQADVIRTFRDGSEVLSNPFQPMMALPPGTYRPMEEMNRFAPQVGAYRFRTLTPDERSRIDKIEKKRNKNQQETAQARFKFRGYDTPSMMWSSEPTYQPFFRPDDRFTHNNQPVQTYLYHPHQSQQSYNPSYQPPLFRQENQER